MVDGKKQHIQAAFRGTFTDPSLHQIVLLQVQLEDSVLDRGKDEPDVLCVGRAREMRVDDCVAVRVQLDEHFQNVLPRCLAVLLRSCKCVW